MWWELGGATWRPPATPSPLAVQPNAPPASPTAILTTHREALSLYRAIWRATRWFEWPNAEGVPFRETLRASARSEFEAARGERDPELITRMLVVGRDALAQAMERLATQAAKPPPRPGAGGGGGPRPP